MEPALRSGDRLLLARPVRARHQVRVRRGQIVVARRPGDESLLLVKRAIWLEDGGWWLDSDNPRAGAVDSWRFGPVPPALIEGRLLLRYWPPRLRPPRLRPPRTRSGRGRPGWPPPPGSGT